MDESSGGNFKVAIVEIDAQMLKNAFVAGAYNLDKNKEYINELNVFPVPDGDTGSNMSLTIMAAAGEVNSLTNPTIETLAKTISSGSLRGARGNSGVILSQLLRGFCKEIRDKKSITIQVVADGFVRGVETAYKAVMKPKEGTILTVAKSMAEKASYIADTAKDFEEFAEEVIAEGEKSLANTPNLLPVLKEAGVVDSGGQGLMEFIKGVYNGLLGKEIVTENIPTGTAPSVSVSSEDIDTSHIKFGYCTEFIILLENEYNMDIEAEFKEYLMSIGDSLVVVSDDEIVKVHVHTNHPGLAFERGLTYGQLTRMKIDNMREEHREKVINEQDKQRAKEAEAAKPKEPPKPYGFVTVSAGDGLAEIFKELGVDYVISGGQTMNPSTDDIISAVDKVNAETIYVMPNNKNIILAANQAATIVKDKKLIVLETKTVPQGIAAMIGFLPDASAEDNKESMMDAVSQVKSGQVTYAVRDTSVDGKEIKVGDYMGISDKGIESVGKDIQEVIKELVESMTDDVTELISIYYGSDVTEEDAQAIEGALSEAYPDYEVELHAGGQPVYYYIISVE